MAEQAQPRAAVRLVFEYDRDGIRLVSEDPLEKTLPETEALSRALPSPGVYVDLRDAAEGVLSRTSVHGAMSSAVEVFPEHPGEPIVRVPAPERGAFTVVVPATPGADHVAVVDVPPAPAGGIALPSGIGGVRELARFKLAG